MVGKFNAFILLLIGSLIFINCSHTPPDQSLSDRGKYFVHKGTGSPILNIKSWNIAQNSVVDNLTPDIGVAVSYEQKSKSENSPIITLFILYRKAAVEPKQAVETRMRGSFPHLKFARTEMLTLPNKSQVEAKVYSYLGNITIPFVGKYLPIAPEEGSELEAYLVQDPRLSNRVYWVNLVKEHKDRDMESILKFLQQYINSTKKKPEIRKVPSLGKID